MLKEQKVLIWLAAIYLSMIVVAGFAIQGVEDHWWPVWAGVAVLSLLIIFTFIGCYLMYWLGKSGY